MAYGVTSRAAPADPVAGGRGDGEAPGLAPGAVGACARTGVDRFLVRADGIHYAYGFRRVLDGVDFRLGAGEIVAIFGPNGAGKSTLLRILCGFLEPIEGQVHWDLGAAGVHGAHGPLGLTASGVVAAGAACAVPRMAFIGHRSHLFHELSAQENLVYYARLLGLPHPAQAADAALRAEGLALFADRPVATFSRGMVQRLSLCRAWLADPWVVFADEPATGLDPEAAARLAVALGAVRARGGAAALVAHDLTAALQIADRYVLVAGGHIAGSGAAAPWRGCTDAFAEIFRQDVARARGRARTGRSPAGGVSEYSVIRAVPPGPDAATPRSPGSDPACRTWQPSDDREPHMGPGPLGIPAAAGPRRAAAPVPGLNRHAARQRPGRLAVLSAVFTREMTLWWRGQERLGALLANGVLVALVFGFAFDPGAVDLTRIFAGILWVSLLFTGLPAFGRGFALEWETDALDGYLSCGAEPTVLFYGKCLANLVGFVLAAAVLLPVFLALLQVTPGPDLRGAMLALLLGSSGFVAAGTLLAAVVSRALGRGGPGLLPLIALPLLAPIIFGTARLAQGFFDASPEMTGVWFLLLAVYSLVFWALPAVVFPIIAAG